MEFGEGRAGVPVAVLRARTIYRLALRLGWAMGLAVIALLWFGAWAAGLVPPNVLPPPQTVVLRFAADLVTLQTWENVFVTFQAWFLAVPIGFFAAVAVAVVLVAFPAAFRALEPYLMMANAVPRVVLAPVFILALGLGLGSRVALGVSLILFPTILGVYGGLRLCNPALIASVESFGATQRAVWRHVRLPAALPYLIANWRLATSLGLLGAIVGEILIAPNGLGWLIRIRAGVFDVAGVFSTLLIVLALALLVNVITDFASAKLLKWQ